MIDIVKKISILCIIMLLFGSRIYAQVGKYLVIFKDKANNTHSIANPLTFVNQRSIDRRTNQGIPFAEYDLPPTQSYVDGLAAAGATVWYTSRWLNAALVLMTPAQATTVLVLPYVKGFENNGPMDLNLLGNPGARKANKFDIHLENVNHGNAVNQTNMLGLQHLHNASFKGEGKIIALLDDGFNSIDKDIYLASLFSENRVVETYDFVLNQAGVYDIGGHGNLVLSCIAANVTGLFVGTAPQAKYALFRTEDAPTERIIEEANYLFGCERADAIGADIVNSSLGYSTYDYPAYNHITSDYNGDKTLVTRAADWAARAGMLVCTSQGNSGSAGIAAPADADSVMSVGGVTAAEIYWGSSSVGPTFDGRTKPDVSAKGQSATVSQYSSGTTQILTASGTSFSSPIMAGFAACYWQANPELNNMQVLNAIRNIGTQAAIPDNLLGWGIPKYPNLMIANDQDFRTKIIQPGIQNTFLTADNRRIIAQIHPDLAGGTPITGEVFVKAKIDAETQIVNGMPTVTRHFEITPLTNPSIVSASVTLFITQSEVELYDANNSNFQNLIDNNNPGKLAWLRIIQKKTLPNNTSTFNMIETDLSRIRWNANENFWEITFSVNGFSEFYITTFSNNVLPVNLLKFEVKQSVNGNELVWETSQESNFSHFEIEKSTDVKTFVKIGEIRSNESGHYTYLENSSLITYNSSLLFYRLKMIDLDGKFNYSKIVSIKNEEDFEVNILENPISNELVIELSNKLNGEIEIQINDIMGRSIFSKQINLYSNQLKINAVNWRVGEYILNISSKNNKISKKILKR